MRSGIGVPKERKWHESGRKLQKHASKASSEGWEQDRLLDGHSTTRPIPSWKRRNYGICTLMTALLVTSMLLFAAAAIMLAWNLIPHERSVPVSWLPPDVSTTRIFTLERVFSSDTAEGEEAWMQLIPRGKGFVYVNNETQLEPMPGLDLSVQHQKAMVAVFHQLHCLYNVQKSYFNLQRGTHDDIEPMHVEHCWDYLRQALICASDTTLEWMAAPPLDKGVSGYGYQHQCRDYDAVFAWAEQHRVDDNKRRSL